MPITAADLMRAKTVWDSRGFVFETEEIRSLAFDVFCKLLAELNTSQKELLLKLVGAFEKYSLQHYAPLLQAAVSQIPASKLAGVERVFLLPVLNSGDRMRGSNKSGHGVLYMAEHVVLRHSSLFKNLPIIALVDPAKLSSTEFESRKNSLIVFLDDFIGSGDTVKSALQDYGRFSANASDRQIIVTLAGMATAIDAIRSGGTNIYCGRILKKGVSENSAIVDKKDALLTMDSIEGSLDRPADCRWGYKQSEALVSLVRTPDNTFPVFWCASRLGGGQWPAPFPRD